MAVKIIEQRTSDLSGKPEAEEVSFAINGTQYTLDLVKSEQEALFKALQQYVDVARKGSARSTGSTRTRRSSSSSTENPGEVREWLRANGYGDEVSDRGRIAAHLQEAYKTKTPKASA